MIEAGEVGAVFTVVDKASAVLKAIADQLKALQAQIDRVTASFAQLGSGASLARFNQQLGVADGRLAKLAGTSEKTAVAIGRNFDNAASAIDGGMGKATSAAIADLGKIDAAAAATAANVGRIGRGSALLGGRGGGGGGGPGRSPSGPGFSGVHVPLPGGSGLHIPGGPIIAGAATAAYATYLASTMEDRIFQLEYHAGLKDTPENSARLKDILQGAMSKTGMTLDQVSAAALDEVRMFKGTPGGGLDVLPEMLTAAATESRLKGSSLNESMDALIGLAHMTKEYGPEEIKKLAPTFAFLSASNPAALKSIERAASYAAPILQSGMDIDPTQSLLLGTVLTRAGATNTKSGTWLRNMALAAMPGTSLQSKTAFKKHEAALRELGLIDKHGQPTWFTDGKPDLVKMLETAGPRGAKLPLIKRAGYEAQLFGKQGYGAFALLADPAVQKQIAALGTEMNSPEFKTRYANFMQDYSAASPLQKGRQTWADAQNALTDLGTTTLPAATAALNFFDGALKNLVAIPGILRALNNTPNPFNKGGMPSAGGVLPGPTTGPASTVSPNTAGLGPVTLAPESMSGITAGWEKAARAIPPPKFQTDTKVDVKVMIDGAAIAAQIEKHIEQNTRVINGTSGFDTGAGVMPTDGGFVGP